MCEIEQLKKWLEFQGSNGCKLHNYIEDLEINISDLEDYIRDLENTIKETQRELNRII